MLAVCPIAMLEQPEESFNARATDAFGWRPLRILTVYRLIVVASLTLATLVAAGAGFHMAADPNLLLPICFGYLAFSIVAFVLAARRRPRFAWQVNTQVCVDIVAIAALIQSSGSLGSGLGVLMLVAVAAGSILTSARIAFFFAALASLILLAQQTYNHILGHASADGYPQLGLLGMGIFATALVGNLVARRARENQLLADRREVDLANLQALNHSIVQRLPDGVIALDANDRIRLSNQAAWQLLGAAAAQPRAALPEVAPALAQIVRQWRGGLEPPGDLVLIGERSNYRPRFQALDPDRKQVLVFLHDIAELKAQVQQEKLAELGRFTASVAHEIRNPLSAIVHAGQLLEEAEELQPANRRLVQIIRKQSARLNGVVANVLQLSRRRAADRHPLRLADWLREFCNDFRLQYPHHSFYLASEVDPPNLTVLFDHNHLQQILDNLCSNALRHGGKSENLQIRLQARQRPSGQTELLVYDNGHGIDLETERRMFEPFFTTANTGTGLGLYLCRELCEANQAQLEHVPTASGSCFRIRFGIAHMEVA